MSNEILKNDTAITLDWADVSGADLYGLDVSLYPDFSTNFVSDDALAASTKAFTDTGAGDEKRYWRWRYSTNTGTTWSEWSEVGSYWVKAGAAADVTLTAGQWAIFDPDLVTDRYTFSLPPVYSIVNTNINRFKARNRLGVLLSEYLTNKSTISLNFKGAQFITREQMSALRRFNEEIKTFFLACYKSNETDTVPHIWKVEFQEDPSLTMLGSGREGLYEGSLILEEV